MLLIAQTLNMCQYNLQTPGVKMPKRRMKDKRGVFMFRVRWKYHDMPGPVSLYFRS